MISVHERRVAVLMGGFGGERNVSLKSGRAVVQGLRDAGHNAIPYDVQDAGLPGLRRMQPEVAFLALHGTWGEDGAVQQLLEQMDIPYTGSGPKASRLGMDKLATKRLFVQHSVPTPDYFTIQPDVVAQEAAFAARDFGYPLVLKPSASGSSLGVGIVREPGLLPRALAAAREHGEVLLAERLVRGREFTIGVLEGEALPVIELLVGREFFDYRAKYHDENTRYVLPVTLLPTIYRKACDFAVRAYHAIGCRHLARVDLMYGWDGRLYILEVNTIPGFTPRSLLPMAAAAVGISFPELCHRLVLAALRDAARRRALRRPA